VNNSSCHIRSANLWQGTQQRTGGGGQRSVTSHSAALKSTQKDWAAHTACFQTLGLPSLL